MGEVQIKNFLCFIATFLLVFPITAFAQETQSGPYSMSNAEKAAFLDELSPRMTDQLVSSMAAELCGIMNNANRIVDYPVVDALERNLLRFANIDDSDSLKNAKISAFWNEYSDQMICPSLSGFYPKQHFYKRAIEMHLQQPVLEGYFFHDAVSFPIEVNAVELLESGRRSTLLDYIDAALEMDEAEDRYNIDEIEELRDYLIEEHGAKRFTDL